MSTIIEHINKVFDNRVRLGIMSMLIVNEKVDFNDLKQQLDVTDGNLASHLKALELADYVLVLKSFVGKKPNTRFEATKSGRIAFMAHLAALEKLIKNAK